MSSGLRSLLAWGVLLVVPAVFFVVMARGGDRDETMFETPEGQTEYRLRALGQRAEAYADSSGRPPAAMEELLAAAGPGFDARDAWGRAIRYQAAGGGFEIRSRGRDGRFGGTDDIVVRGPAANRGGPAAGPANP